MLNKTTYSNLFRKHISELSIKTYFKIVQQNKVSKMLHHSTKHQLKKIITINLYPSVTDNSNETNMRKMINKRSKVFVPSSNSHKLLLLFLSICTQRTSTYKQNNNNYQTDMVAVQKIIKGGIKINNNNYQTNNLFAQ